jgi:hypothetical protein
VFQTPIITAVCAALRLTMYLVHPTSEAFNTSWEQLLYCLLSVVPVLRYQLLSDLHTHEHRSAKTSPSYTEYKLTF